MDEGKLIADFIAANMSNILDIAKSTYKTVDTKLQTRLKTAYRKYIALTHEKYSKSKSFFIRSEAVDLYDYYVPTGISNNKTTISNPSFDTVLDTSKRLVITGTGGCGKSVLMKHLFLDCLRSKKYIPILIELRDLNENNDSLKSAIDYVLDTFEFDVEKKYLEQAKKLGHVCFFLDGYDEVNHSKRRALLKEIKDLSSRNLSCPIYISSRPDDTFNGIDEFSIYKVNPLTLSTAIELITKLPFDEAIKSKFIGDLKSGLFKKHESFLSNPLLLSIMLLTYGENAEIPSKLSIFYNQAYEALFQRHDANKGGFKRVRLTDLDIQDFARVFSLFALQTYEKRQFKMTKLEALTYLEKSAKLLNIPLKAEDYLFDLLNAACLLIEDGLDIAFSHRSFQEYFVALHINTAAPEIQEKLLDRYSKNIISDKVINLLLEINPELVERLVLLPKLEALFKRIGVKSSVGITHAAKYIKESYSSLNIDKEGISATVSSLENCSSSFVHMAVSHCNLYTYPDNDYFEKHKANMLKKFGNPKKKISYPTKDMTFRTPIMNEFLNSRGAFSKYYLQAAYQAYKTLKNKSQKSTESLETLLGI